MKKLINKKKFEEIFKDKNLRIKLDNLILSFFGLDNNYLIDQSNIKENDILLEFHLLLNSEELLKIKVVDTKPYFKSSKKFYLNLSYQQVNKYFVLLIPCYFDIYTIYNLNNLNYKNKFLLFSSIFASNKLEEIESILKKLKIFSRKEIKNILNIIEDK